MKSLVWLLLVLCGCYRINIVEGTDDGGSRDGAMSDSALPDATMPDAAMPDAEMLDAAMPDTPMEPDAPLATSVEGRFGALVGADFEGDTWLVARAREAMTLEALPLHLFRPDYSGDVPVIGEPFLIPGTTGWNMAAAARWGESIAMVIEFEQGLSELLVYDAATGRVDRAPIPNEGTGVVTARIAMDESNIYVTSSWGLVDDQMFIAYSRVGPFVPQTPIVLGRRLGAVPVVVVRGEAMLAIREGGVVRVGQVVDGRVVIVRDVGEGLLPTWAGESLLTLSSFGRQQLLLEGLEVGTYPEASQINGYPSARLDDAEFLVAMGLGGFGGVSWAYQPSVFSTLEWHAGPAEGLTGWHVAHLGQGHAGTFYLDTILGARLPRLRYSGVRTGF